MERAIYRRSTGVLEVCFKDEGGRLRWQTVDGGILAARKLRDDLAARKARGEQVAPNPKLRFGEAACDWLTGPVLDMRDTTQVKYRSIVDGHLRPRFDARRLDAAARDRFRAAGGKFDRFDAFVLCELARADGHRFRVLEPDSEETKALRALTRAREDLVHAALLARPHPLRPGQTPRPATTLNGHSPHVVGPRARPRRHPADGRDRRHPTGGPQGRARSA